MCYLVCLATKIRFSEYKNKQNGENMLKCIENISHSK